MSTTFSLIKLRDMANPSAEILSPEKIFRFLEPSRKGVVELRSPQAYVARLTGVKNVLGCYFMKGHNLIHGHVSFHNHTIAHRLVDEQGFDKGRKAVMSGSINLSEEGLWGEGTIEKVGQKCFFIMNSSDHVFFSHWLFEWLPKFLYSREIYQDDPNTLFVVSSLVPERFIDWARLLFDFNFKVLKLEPRVNYEFEEIYVPSSPTMRNELTQAPETCIPVMYQMVSELRNKANVQFFPKSQHKRAIFIPRSGTSWRRMVNEKEVISILGGLFDLEIVQFDTLDAIAQIKKISECSFLFTTAGSAGSISMFMSPGCKIVEFCHPRHVAAFTCWIWAAIFGLEYLRVDGRVVGERRGPTLVDEDFEVDLKMVLQAVKSL